MLLPPNNYAFTSAPHFSLFPIKIVTKSALKLTIMKKVTLPIILCILIALMASCGTKTSNDSEQQEATEIQWEHYAFADSSYYGHVELKATVPVATDSVTQVIRDSLIAIIQRNATSFLPTEGNTPVIKPYQGNDSTLKAILTYYGKNVLAYINKENKAIIDDYIDRISQDTTMTEQQKEDAKEVRPQWIYSMNITLQDSDSLFISFNDEEYGFWGGAHGGVLGDGVVTFRADNGQRLRSIIRSDAVTKMQPLIKKGLKEYFQEQGEQLPDDNQLMQMLMLPDQSGIIPLPSHYEPYPSEKGIVFTYAQYEIACYAAGMPTFTIPYSDVQPFLSDEFKKIIKL